MQKPIPEESFLRGIIDNTPAAYLVIDKNFNVQFANDFIVKIAGISYEELIGQKCYLTKGEKQICENCIVKKAFETGKKQYRLNRELDKAGNIRYNDNFGVPLLNPAGGGFDYVVEILTDRTEEMRYQKQLAADFYSMVDTFTIIVEAKDEYTANHSKNVRELSMLIAERLGLSLAEKRDIYVAASLHDIGKIGIPDAIINKPGKLTTEEYNIIKTHPRIGVDLLSKLDSFDNLKGNVLYHHERWDGGGYPENIGGNDIPIGARIIAVADAYDAMTSDRPYRKGMPHGVAAKELIIGSGKQFAPRIVSAFLDVCAATMPPNSNNLWEFIEKKPSEEDLFFENFADEIGKEINDK